MLECASFENTHSFLDIYFYNVLLLYIVTNVNGNKFSTRYIYATEFCKAKVKDNVKKKKKEDSPL